MKIRVEVETLYDPWVRLKMTIDLLKESMEKLGLSMTKGERALAGLPQATPDEEYPH